MLLDEMRRYVDQIKSESSEEKQKLIVDHDKQLAQLSELVDELKVMLYLQLIL